MSQVQMDAPALNEQELNEIYNWVDTIPLSRPKKHISRDFADGVLMAEIVKYYLPNLVEIHNYSAAHSIQQKQYNWSTLNAKVFRRMGFQLSTNDSDAVINCVPEAIERVLKVVQVKLQMYMDQQKIQPIDKKGNPVPKIKRPNNDQSYQQPYSNQNEKDLIIQDQRETIEILELKIQKLEQLLKLKDNKINNLTTKLQNAGIR